MAKVAKNITLEEAEETLAILNQYQEADLIAAASATSEHTVELVYSMIIRRSATINALKRWIYKNAK